MGAATIGSDSRLDGAGASAGDSGDSTVDTVDSAVDTSDGAVDTDDSVIANVDNVDDTARSAVATCVSTVDTCSGTIDTGVSAVDSGDFTLGVGASAAALAGSVPHKGRDPVATIDSVPGRGVAAPDGVGPPLARVDPLDDGDDRSLKTRRPRVRTAIPRLAAAFPFISRTSSRSTPPSSVVDTAISVVDSGASVVDMTVSAVQRAVAIHIKDAAAIGNVGGVDDRGVSVVETDASTADRRVSVAESALSVDGKAISAGHVHPSAVDTGVSVVDTLDSAFAAVGSADDGGGPTVAGGDPLDDTVDAPAAIAPSAIHAPGIRQGAHVPCGPTSAAGRTGRGNTTRASNSHGGVLHECKATEDRPAVLAGGDLDVNTAMIDQPPSRRSAAYWRRHRATDIYAQQQQQSRGVESAQAHTVASLRDSLRDNSMRPIATIALAKLPITPNLRSAFVLPPAKTNALTLISMGQTMGQAAAPYAQVFVQNGLKSKFLDDLNAAITALHTAVTAADNSRVTSEGATSGNKEQLAAGKQAVKLLDAIVRPALASSKTLLAQWDTVRRLAGAPNLGAPAPLPNVLQPITTPASTPTMSSSAATTPSTTSTASGNTPSGSPSGSSQPPAA